MERTQIYNTKYTRELSFDGTAINDSERTVDLSFSSEFPVERVYGWEILSHDAGAMNMERLSDGANLLWNHNQIGRASCRERV